MKILYLTEWYPHRYDPMPGLFVRKHAAAAVRQGVDVCVLFFLKDKKVQSGVEIVEQTTDGITEIYAYYAGSFFSAVRQGWQAVKKSWGMPHLTQLNVLTKNGLLAYWLKKRYGIPYILIEHWSGYLPENNSFRGGWHGWLMKQIAKDASVIMPVSQALENGMKAAGIRNDHWERIHNVVDDFFYEGNAPKAKQEGTVFRFLHVSCFDERSKNTQGILRAVALLYSKRQDFELHLVGTGPDFEASVHTAEVLGIHNMVVFFDGEKTPEGVHDAMVESDCFVLFSRYENAPVVLSESMACGLPIIATRVGGIPEMVNPENGILVESENVEELAQAMNTMISQAKLFDKSKIQHLGNCYSMQVVGAHLAQTYEKFA